MSRTEALWKPGLPLLRMEDSMDENGKDSYIAGMKRYRERGIPIVIDGEKCTEPDWNRIFEAREDNSFYMADFVSDEKTGKLTEIRFDRVYHRSSAISQGNGASGRDRGKCDGTAAAGSEG